MGLATKNCQKILTLMSVFPRNLKKNWGKFLRTPFGGAKTLKSENWFDNFFWQECGKTVARLVCECVCELFVNGYCRCVLCNLFVKCIMCNI